MFLVVYAESLGPGVPADLVAGALQIGSRCALHLANGRRLSAEVKDGDGDGDAVLEVQGERWRLVRRSDAPMNVAASSVQPPVERWVFQARLAGAAEPAPA